jgi:flagellar motor switch protein FliM
MEMVELSQKEINALLSLMEDVDLESMKLPLTISELIALHAKLSASQIF